MPIIEETTMNANAAEVFAAYNEYRKSINAPIVQWDDELQKMAMISADGCAKEGKLIHRLGIPDDKYNQYSDILAYSTNLPAGREVVEWWRNSRGHRRQMQCESARRAAVAVSRSDSGMFHYVLVYDFENCNQSGD